MNKSIPLEEFSPVSMLQTRESLISGPKFPVIDAHNHLGKSFGHPWSDRPVSELIAQMDLLKIKTIIDLDGGFGTETLKSHLKHFKQKEPNRFIHFGGIDFGHIKKGRESFQNYVNEQINSISQMGAQGIKIWKNLGLHVRDSENSLIRINDTILNPIWDKAAELSLPIMIHVADPLAFFHPMDFHNERIEELNQNPDWHFPADSFPSFYQIIDDFYDMILKNPATTFIGAHVGCYAENLKRVSEVLDLCPNFYVDTSARLAELGRQPYSSYDFFMKYQDRIVFGTDMGMDQRVYRNYFRFFETRDEYFNYDSNTIPSQGRWNIYGINLPDSVLKKIYFENIMKILKLS